MPAASRVHVHVHIIHVVCASPNKSQCLYSCKFIQLLTGRSKDIIVKCLMMKIMPHDNIIHVIIVCHKMIHYYNIPHLKETNLNKN